MGIIVIIFIAVGLAMDAFAVSVSSGITIQKLNISHAVKIAFFFGLFQALMPVIGWLAGVGLRDLIKEIDHWVAFGLLSLIGCRMIFESMRKDENKKAINPLHLTVLLTLSVATSIDALAVGISFAFLNISILIPVIIIGIITFLLSFLGVFLGDRIGKIFANKIEIVGGIILIAIGAKILIEHLS